ncbi:hypothetical protein [Actinoplanes sp. L3-i22]|uniref:hypothetical protein n=1 Tax=Actinoplanes sp. L3-i22 TaxID=2836373 RepID=UPI001C85AC0F|nr:hypothetical protein [Actinoplanes sp. L3-i22]
MVTENQPSISRRTVLGATVAAIGSPALAAPEAGTLEVGAGKAAIAVPGSLLPLDGFTTVHDDLYVRVLLLAGSGTTVALAILDLTSISAEAITAMRTVIGEATGVPAANIMVTVTHTFSAPHVQATTQSAQAAAWVASIVAATRSAAGAAAATRAPAKVGYGSGTCDVNVNRNVATAAGYWLGTGESLPSSKTVTVARFDDLAGRPIAVLANYDVQSCVMMESVTAGGDLPITADLAGAAVAHVEAQYGPDTVGFFLVGACGDQFPAYRAKRYTIDKDRNWSQVDAGDAGWTLLTVQGERLGTEIVRVAQTITTGGRAALGYTRSAVTVATIAQGHPTGPVTSYDFTPTGTASAPLWVFRLGAAVFVGASPELSTGTALDIREHSGFRHTFVASMFEGGAKNMADRWNYAHVTYEAVDSGYAPGSAERLAARAETVTKQLR